MPLSDEFGRIPLREVLVDRETRQRSKLDVSDLTASIARNGVIHPIVIDRGTNRLRAGERRLQASKELGLPDIIFRYADQLSPIEGEIIELEENLKRQDLRWQDIVRATERIHNLYRSLEPDWTQDQTAEALSLTKGTVSDYLLIARSLGDELVSTSESIVTARNFLRRRQQRLADEHLEEFLAAAPPASPAPPQTHLALLNGATPLAPSEAARPLEPAPPGFQSEAQTILIQDFLTWAPKYRGPKFNLLHCDFPYGLRIDSFQMMSSTAFKDGRGYPDREASFDDLLECLFQNFDRLISLSAHILFWYDASLEALSSLVEHWRKAVPSVKWYKSPLIWHKSDNSGIPSDTQRSPRHIYETCLFGTRSDRLVVQTVGDVYSCATDNRLHASAKPEPMLRHFMRMLVDENTTLLDPTAGSGAALRAAESLGAKRVLGLEVSEDLALQARLELRKFRLNRLRDAKMREARHHGAVVAEQTGL